MHPYTPPEATNDLKDINRRAAACDTTYHGPGQRSEEQLEESTQDQETDSEKLERHVKTKMPPAMERQVKEYAIKFKKKHPSTTPQRLTQLVCKKFNITLK